MSAKIINEITPFVIYGAGHNGRSIYNCLKEMDMNVVAFLDKSAQCLQPYDGINIYLPNDSFMEKMKKECIIILSLLNFFDHAKVAEELVSLGYSYVLFKNDLQLPMEREKFKRINEIYDLLVFQKQKIGQLSIPKLEISDFDPFLIDCGIIEQRNDSVIVHIPIELLLFKEKEDQALQHILLNTERSDLFHVFQNAAIQEAQHKIHKYCESSFEIGSYNMNDTKNNYDEFERRLITSRYDVYEKMNKMFDFNPHFFILNPIKCKYLGNSKFHVLDGTHRLSFLMMKGKRDVPCSISKDDYIKWKNEKHAKNVLNLMQKFHFKEIHTVLNPFFYHLNNDKESYIRSVLASIIQNIKIDKNFKKKHYMEINVKTNYTSMLFSLMGLSLKVVLDVSYPLILFHAIQELYDIQCMAYENISDLTKEHIDVLISINDIVNTKVQLDKILSLNIPECYIAVASDVLKQYELSFDQEEVIQELFYHNQHIKVLKLKRRVD